MRSDEELIRSALGSIAELAPSDRLAGSGAELRRSAGQQPSPAHQHRPVARRATIALLTVLLVAGLVTLGLVNGSTPRPAATPTSTSPGTHIAPLVDTAATPAGWSPVAYGNIQVSVPSGWLVEDPGYECGGDVQGMVFVSEAPQIPGTTACGLAPNLVSLEAAEISPVPAARAETVNGIAVELGQSRTGSTVTYVERALGMDVAARGPLAREVLQTLTHSALSVVLDSEVTGTPNGWRVITFGGLRFSTPDAWRVTRDSWWGGCPGGIEPNVLRLSTAESFSAPSCPPPPPTAAFYAAVAGMVVGAGPEVSAADVPAEQCVHHNGLRICIEPPPPANGGFEQGRQIDLMTATVFVRGEKQPIQVEIGLAGSGLTPLEIFDSLAPAAAR